MSDGFNKNDEPEEVVGSFSAKDLEDHYIKLYERKIGKKPELNHLWESFESLCKIIDIHMDFTESLYQKVVRKIYLKRDKQ